MTIGISYVTPDHLSTIGARLGQGRFITGADHAGAPLVAVVSEPLAAALWPSTSPIGRTLEVYTANGSLNGARTVVGTVQRIAFNLDADPGLDVFLPASQAAWTSGVIFAKGALPPADLGRRIATTVAAIDRTVPVRDVGGLDAALRRSLSIELFLRNALLAFGLTGLLLAAIGTYAVIAQTVARSRRELGVRMALGASARQIQSLVARRGIAIALIAGAAGALGQTWSARLLTSFLHGLPATDVISMAAGPLITMAVIAAAVALPALTASRTNPAVVLRPD